MRTSISGQTDSINGNCKVEFYEVKPCLSELPHTPALNSFKQNPKLAMEVSRITEAIQEVTWLPFEAYKGGPNDVNCYFARMIFSFHCRQAGFSPRMITAFVDRKRNTVLRYLKNYKSEYKFNPAFREIAEKVKQRLGNNGTAH